MIATSRALLLALVSLAACSDSPHAPRTAHEIGVPVSEDCIEPGDCPGAEPVVPQLVKTPVGPEDRTSGVPYVVRGIDVVDGDNDGVAFERDCDDHNAHRYPGAFDAPCDGIDQNCDGHDVCDQDRDGFTDEIDCSPSDPKLSTQCWNVPEHKLTL